MKFIALISLLCFFWVFYTVWYEDHSVSIPGKLLWTLAALFFSIPTALFYFFSKRRGEPSKGLTSLLNGSSQETCQA
ncbi:MAG: hypothetical protein H6573_13065 [Lewinellaceae bacterium]|nr:hypothetical protein [Lewinellaceae bacterium]